MSETTIKCPNCGTEIDVNNILSSQLEDRYKKEFSQKIAEQNSKFKAQQDEIDKQKSQIEEKQKEQAELIKKEVDSKIKAEKIELENLRIKLEEERFEQEKLIRDSVALKVRKEKEQFEIQIKAKIEEENSEQIESMRKELNEKSEKVKELNNAKAEIERIKREKSELEESIKADAEKQLTLKLQEQGEIIRKQEQDRIELKMKELHVQLEQQKKLTEEMRKKQEQGSMQLQGEVQELVIEEWLKDKFIYDEIKEVPKGVRGADCLHVISNKIGEECGIICYESKRTKSFSNEWIGKFKDDISIIKANVGVLVTEVYPKGMERMGMVDGIWICSYDEFKGLCFVLRENIIKLSEAISSQENKGEKSVMLYNFLISNEFRLEIEAIVEGFTQMQIDLIAEKKINSRTVEKT